MTNFKELWDRSGNDYQNYGLRYPQYLNTNKKITEMSDLGPGQRVVDLACGTGLTAKYILEKLRDTGNIYCLDFSDDMIRQAKIFLIADNVEFIVAAAEDVGNFVSEPVDRVICNAGFWQFGDKPAVLKSISTILKNDGLFVFNLPQQFYEIEGPSHRGKIIEIIFDELKKRGYAAESKLVPKFNEPSLRELMSENGLEIEKIELHKFEGSTLDDGIAFFRIPAVAPFFEGVENKVQEEILSIVKEKLEKEYKIFPNVWAYFIVKKKQ